MRTLSCIFFALLSKAIFAPALSAQGIYQLWGMTSNGGSDNIGSAKVGTIFSIDPSKDEVYTRHEFRILALGYYARGNLTEYMGKFYGTTQVAGANGKRVIFEWDTISDIVKLI
jgi:hypothetical protein